MLINETESTITSANKSLVHHLKLATNSREKYVIETFFFSFGLMLQKHTHALL